MNQLNDILVLENCISKENQDLIEKVFTDWSVNWAFNVSASTSLQYRDVFLSYNTQEAIESPCFTHTIINDNQQLNPPYIMLFLPLLSAIPCSIEKILRFKINCTMPNNLDPKMYGIPHIDLFDLKQKYLTAIYYINDADGATVLFDQFFGDLPHNMNIAKKITPKKGKMVIFDGHRLHSGNTPKNTGYRITANINFTVNNLCL